MKKYFLNFIALLGFISLIEKILKKDPTDTSFFIYLYFSFFGFVYIWKGCEKEFETIKNKYIKYLLIISVSCIIAIALGYCFSFEFCKFY